MSVPLLRTVLLHAVTVTTSMLLFALSLLLLLCLVELLQLEALLQQLLLLGQQVLLRGRQPRSAADCLGGVGAAHASYAGQVCLAHQPQPLLHLHAHIQQYNSKVSKVTQYISQTEHCYLGTVLDERVATVGRPALPHRATVDHLARHHERVLQQYAVRVHGASRQHARVALQHAAHAHEERVESTVR